MKVTPQHHDCCPNCGESMNPEHQHFVCPSCKFIEPCCEVGQ